MTRRWIGIALLLAGSIVIGVLAGNYFYRIFDRTVPPAVITDLVRGTAHGFYILAGLILGVIVFGWALLACWLARFFRPTAGPGPEAH